MKNILFAALTALVFTATMCASTVPAATTNMAQTARVQGEYTRIGSVSRVNFAAPAKCG